MHEEEWEVRFSECDRNRKLTYGNIVNYFQDCSNLQSKSIGRDSEFLKSRQKAWIIDFWQIEINDRPSVFDNIRVATWAAGFKGFFGIRNFTMKTETDEMLACANSYWVYLDMQTGRPVRVPQDEMDAYGMEEALPMETVGRKISVPENAEKIDVLTVKEHHLDLYNHMNNGKYIEIACDYLPENKTVHRICCQYKMQARKGEVIHVFRAVEDNRVTVALKNAEEEIYSVISFDCK